MALHITPCPDAVPKKQKFTKTVFIEAAQVYKLFKVRKNVGLYVPCIQLVKVSFFKNVTSKKSIYLYKVSKTPVLNIICIDYII